MQRSYFENTYKVESGQELPASVTLDSCDLPHWVNDDASHGRKIHGDAIGSNPPIPLPPKLFLSILPESSTDCLQLHKATQNTLLGQLKS